MASTPGGQLDPEPYVRIVKNSGMLNRTLQAICINEGMNKNGVKAELQQRIIDRIRSHARTGDVTMFNRLKALIENPNSLQPGHNTSQYSSNANSMSPAAMNSPSINFGYVRNGEFNMPGGVNFRAGGAGGHHNIEFKSSPFYTIQQQLGETEECQVMTAHRQTVRMRLRASDHPILSRVVNEPTLRVMVFCATEGQGRHDIAFPHQSEIKVNGGEVKANLRGLKNKPGSTRPVDITKELRLKIPIYTNNIEMTYALTTKKFYLILYAVKIVPVTDLVKRLENGRRITKEAVISDMVSKSRDADIVTTATVLSLKCPLSTLRMDLPCRSIACRHVQCFDATSYLQLQEQGPTWLCPICNNSAPFDNLAVDEYVKDILNNTSRSVDQVTIQPDGKWELHTKIEPSRKSNGYASSDDDDLVEITESGDSVKVSTPRPYSTPLGSMPQRSYGQAPSSTAPRGSGSTSTKRPIAAVIDLTSSGDEDDQPLVRAPKRQYSGYAEGSPKVYRPAPTANGYPRP